MSHEEYRFTICAFSPDTISMLRLASYMTDLAKLLGHHESVHFLRVEPGSTVLVERIEFEAVPKVLNRIESVRDGKGPANAMKAFADLNQRLAEDNATGLLTSQCKGELIEFPGRGPAPSFGIFEQQGSFEGQLVEIGGRGDEAHVHLRDGKQVRSGCYATHEMAKTMAPYLYGPTVRVHGQGKWQRESEGSWSLEGFQISSFQILDDSPLLTVVQQLREVPGSGWKDLEDPISELERLRHGDDELH